MFLLNRFLNSNYKPEKCSLTFRYLIFLFLLISLAFNISAGAAPAEEFDFAAMSDSRGMYNGVNKPVLEDLITHMLEKNKNIKFLLFPGDMIDGDKNNPEKIRGQLQTWKKIMEPVYNSQMEWPYVWTVPGNHEIQNKNAENIYRLFFPDVYSNGPEDEKGLSYYFIYKNTLFIGIDTNRWYYGDVENPSDDRTDWRYIKHLDWLEKVLKEGKDKKAKHIFVFGHEPAFPTGGHLRDSLPNLGNFKGSYEWHLQQRDLFWELLSKYKVDAYICGHEHSYSRQKISGVYQIISGGAGAHLYYFNARYGYNPKPKPILQEMTYNEALPYYKILNYQHGQKDNCQASADFLGKRAFHYIIFKVKNDKIIVNVWGEETGESVPMEIKNKNLKLLDEFII